MKKIALIGIGASVFIHFRQELIKTMVAQGHQVYCLAYHYTEKEKQRVTEWGAIAVEHHLNSKGLNPFKDLKAMFDLTKKLRQIKPDIVLSSFVKIVIFGTLAAKLAGVPQIIGMIEGLGNAFTDCGEPAKFKTKLIKSLQIVLYKISLPFLHKLILLNRDDKQDLIDKYHIKVKSLAILGGIGVDLSKFHYKEPDISALSFLFIARLLREKGVFEYLSAAKQIKEKYPQVNFYLLGGIDQENPFALKEDILDDYIQQGIIIYPGHVDNVPEWIIKSTVFVLPSYREGFPMSTQEAMAIGRAVITTNVAGCKDTVREGENGFIIPPHSTQALYDKMEYFIQNPSMAITMGKKSAEIARTELDAKLVNQKLINLLLD
ncbi:glycosyltransferase family 4 protein [Lonepinella sp. BR2930]|uniref:glycosyltransferase family 4 protein n=1 Tax=Lonepinella sp. BR2930 TaxID=3434554 RepID=UPI003F6E2D67